MKSFHRRSTRTPAPTPPPPAAAPPRSLPRVDSVLVAQGLAASRTAAARLILGGRVSLGGERILKPSHAVAADAPLVVAADPTDRFVSRGGLKLAGALAHTRIDVRGLTCLDVGQSTGGFSDCLLQADAARVVGIDVGHGQLAPALRDAPRLSCLEGINARGLDAAQLGAAMPAEGFDLIVCDASFISLNLLLPRWPALLRPGGQVLALVKPQFEVGPQGIGNGGIVRDPRRYAEVETKIRNSAQASGLTVRDFFESPITGSDGNREFFIYATGRDAAPAPNDPT